MREPHTGPLVTVPAVADMDDQILIKHMERRHEQDISTNYKPKELREGVLWRGYHDKMHELYDGRTDGARGMYDHVHKEAENG